MFLFELIVIYPFEKGIQKSLLWVGHLANSWDEWVGADRLMKHTEENVLKQQALDKKQGVDKNSKSGRAAQTKPKSSAGKLYSFIRPKSIYHFALYFLKFRVSLKFIIFGILFCFFFFFSSSCDYISFENFL